MKKNLSNGKLFGVVFGFVGLLSGCTELGLGLNLTADQNGIDGKLSFHLRADGTVEEAATNFEDIAATTGGEVKLGGDLNVNLTDLSKTIPEDAEVVFAIDTTGSMSGAIDSVRQFLIAEISASPKRSYGLVVYRDQGDSYVAETRAVLGQDTMVAIKAAEGMVADGGGDYPEHVAAGIDEALKAPFSPAASHHIIVIGDAPDHGHKDIPLQGVLDKASAQGVRVHAILTVCNDVCKSELELPISTP
jgi:hypothetical protein